MLASHSLGCYPKIIDVGCHLSKVPRKLVGSSKAHLTSSLTSSNSWGYHSSEFYAILLLLIVDQQAL